MEKDTGYIIVLTGNGKGKTTAALGMALRSIGHGLKVSMVQFIKGRAHYGELAAAVRLAPDLEILPMGRGFVRVDPKRPNRKDVKAAQNAWAVARDKIMSGGYSMVILDEINNAIAYGLLPLEDVLGVLKDRPRTLTVVLTGRGAAAQILDIADLVTECNEIKHPFRKGEKARKGIEF
jgi:cob(I)alamin adenosyltransferase